MTFCYLCRTLKTDPWFRTAIILDYPILWEEVGHTLDDGEPLLVKVYFSICSDS